MLCVIGLVAIAGVATAQQAPPEFAQRLQASYRSAFMLYDANGDGVLTREEALGSNLLLGQFAEMDRDRDGRVTQAELERFLGDMPPAAR
jgi:Ca2+-binding EF-hand superfamily protein